MLTPKQLQNLPKPLTDIYSQLSDFVLQDIAMRISGAAKITDTAEYLMYRAKALGLSTDAITKEIARINGIAETEIKKLIAQAAEKSDEFDRKMLGVNEGDTEQLRKLINAQIEQTNGMCTNLTGTLGFAQRTADGRMVYGSATDFLRKQMDMAQMKVMTGVCDYNTAVRQACFALADSGLRTVYYASGRSDRIEVAVRRALMTSVSQLTQKISEQNAAEFGADGWEISAHMDARPSHAVYQGRQYPNSQYESIVLPLITDYNCRHSAYPIILGVTKPSYTEEQLKSLDPPPFTYEGKQYTAYEAQRQMRKMERAMRRQKDRCIVADAVGDKDAFTAASIKLRRQKDYYEDFCKAAGTYTEYERTFVSGYNRHLAGKTGAVTRKQNAFKNAQITLTNDGNGGIINEKTSKASIDMPPKNSTIQRPSHKAALDVTDEYLQSATPLQGNITYDIGYNKSKHKDEIKMSDWLFKTFGGEIRLLNESSVKNQKMPDFLWNGRCWELKSAHSVNGADKLLQHAIKQIQSNPGGVLLNLGDDIDVVALETQIARRTARSKIEKFDIMLLKKNELLKILRYKK